MMIMSTRAHKIKPATDCLEGIDMSGTIVPGTKAVCRAPEGGGTVNMLQNLNEGVD